MYSIEEDPILVIAAAHQHRKLGYWVGRDEIIIGSSADAKKRSS